MKGKKKEAPNRQKEAIKIDNHRLSFQNNQSNHFFEEVVEVNSPQKNILLKSQVKEAYKQMLQGLVDRNTTMKKKAYRWA